jgi:putative sterol carrier protein
VSPNPTTIPEALSWLEERFLPESAAGVTAIYQMSLSGPSEGVISAHIRDGKLSVTAQQSDEADVVFHLAARDFFEILAGEANPDLLLLEERLRIEGDLSLASKLRRYFHTGPGAPT